MNYKYNKEYRLRARVALVQALYSYFLTEAEPKNVVDSLISFFNEYPDKENTSVKFDLKYFTDIFYFTIENIESIDAEITKSSSREIFQIANTELAILRFACAELMLRKEIDGAVIIDQAVNVAHIIGSDGANRFINSNVQDMCLSIRGTTKNKHSNSILNDEKLNTSSKKSNNIDFETKNSNLLDFF